MVTLSCEHCVPDIHNNGDDTAMVVMKITLIMSIIAMIFYSNNDTDISEILLTIKKIIMIA